MAVNLLKNQESLISAWKDVLDDKTRTNWALFGYEGQSNDLKLVSKGGGGIEELTEDLNSGKIMYAFLRVMDPKTSLPKNVLINWQGEGAPNVKKGTCANHVRDVSNFFKGAHVTLNARTEEEVDSQLIIDKVAKSTGSAYSFKERTEHSAVSGPVGTSYKRVIPKQEINAQERDKFWEKEEQEEKQRQEDERRRKEEERRKLEDERKTRESEETAKREAKIIERTRSINQIREAEKVTQDRGAATREDMVEDIEREERERRDRSELLRRQRSQEAQQLIAKRTIDARAVFEQNTSAGQMSRRRASYQPNGQVKPVSDSALPEVTTALRKASLQAQHVPTVHPVEPVSPPTNGNHVEEPTAEEQDWEDDVKHEIPVTNVPTTTQPTSASAGLAEEAGEGAYVNGGHGLTARALYDYQAADATEITFDPGDLITHIEQIDEGWWHGLGPEGIYGLFPANYVELVN